MAELAFRSCIPCGKRFYGSTKKCADCRRQSAQVKANLAEIDRLNHSRSA